MTRRILWRLIQAPLVLWAVYTVTFLMVVAVPGNPFEHEGGRNINPVIEMNLRQRYGMENNWQFYWRYLDRFAHADFGQSLHYKDWTCNQIIRDSLPISAAMGAIALILATILGLTLGVVGAVWRDRPPDHLTILVAVVGISVPSFVVGAALLLIFCVTVQWLPVGGWGQPDQAILPAMTLALPFMAYIARLTRLGMLDVMQSDFLRTARAKGLAEPAVIVRHALRVACLPVLSYLGPAAAAIMTGSFVVEKVFNIPGLGQHFVNAVINRDQMLILAVVTIYSGLIILFNLIVDVAYTWLDPRVAAEAV